MAIKLQVHPRLDENKPVTTSADCQQSSGFNYSAFEDYKELVDNARF